MTVAPIQGDLPDWSRPAPAEAPILIYTNSPGQPSSPAEITFTAPQNAVALAVVGYGSGLTSLTVTGADTGINYLLTDPDPAATFDYNIFPVFTAVESVYNVGYEFSDASNQMFYVLAYTTIPPSGLRVDGLLGVTSPNIVPSAQFVYMNQSVAAGTGFTLLGTIGPTAAGTNLHISSVFARVGKTADYDKAAVFFQFINDSTAAVYGRLAELESDTTQMQILNYACDIDIGYNGNPVDLACYYWNLDTSANQIVAGMTGYVEFL